jgi:hypothetical protein
MKFTTKQVCTALLAVLMLGLTGAGILHHYLGHQITQHAVWMTLTSLTMLTGVATIIQTWPIAGTFPTSAQAVDFNTQISRVVMADGDTVAVLTHNWGISAAQLAAFFPLISFYVQNIGSTAPPVSFALTDSNTVTLNKTGTTGSGGTYVVSLFRPYSATQ